MKKTLLIVVLLVSAHQLFAFSTQGKWRWRKDDASETAATWIAPENTAITINNTNDVLRLRITLYNSGAGGTGGLLDDAQLQDSSNLPGAKWDTVRTAARSNPFMLAGSSANVTDQQATTNQLTTQNVAYSFVPGLVLVSTEFLPSFTLNKKQQSEYEYCIKPTLNIQGGVTYYFRVAAAEYPTGLVFPALSTADVLPIHLTDFKVQPDNNHIKVMWTTTSEVNNDRFEVERSADATNWKTVATIKGIGTSSTAHNYNTLDVSPVKGMNYYRIKQYDVDGKYKISETRSLKLITGQVNNLSIIQNPAIDAVRFVLQNSSDSKVSVTLSAVNGRVMHSEKIQLSAANNIYTLSLAKMPAPGIYILKVKGDGFDESVKVVVQ